MSNHRSTIILKLSNLESKLSKFSFDSENQLKVEEIKQSVKELKQSLQVSSLESIEKELNDFQFFDLCHQFFE